MLKLIIFISLALTTTGQLSGFPGGGGTTGSGGLPPGGLSGATGSSTTGEGSGASGGSGLSGLSGELSGGATTGLDCVPVSWPDVTVSIDGHSIVSWWNFYHLPPPWADYAPNVLWDFAQGRNNAYINGTLTYVKGPILYMLALNNTGSTSVVNGATFSFSPSWASLPTLSVLGYLNFQPIPNNTVGTAFSFGINHYGVLIGVAGVSQYHQAVYCYVGHGNGSSVAYTIVPANTWVHVACTVYKNYVRLYIDANLTQTVPMPRNYSVLPPGDTFWPGMIGSNPIYPLENNYKGAFADVRLYSRALTATEIFRCIWVAQYTFCPASGGALFTDGGLFGKRFAAFQSRSALSDDQDPGPGPDPVPDPVPVNVPSAPAGVAASFTVVAAVAMLAVIAVLVATRRRRADVVVA